MVDVSETSSPLGIETQSTSVYAVGVINSPTLAHYSLVVSILSTLQPNLICLIWAEVTEELVFVQ